MNLLEIKSWVYEYKITNKSWKKKRKRNFDTYQTARKGKFSIKKTSYKKEYKNLCAEYFISQSSTGEAEPLGNKYKEVYWKKLASILAGAGWASPKSMGQAVRKGRDWGSSQNFSS